MARNSSDPFHVWKIRGVPEFVHCSRRSVGSIRGCPKRHAMLHVLVKPGTVCQVLEDAARNSQQGTRNVALSHFDIFWEQM